MHFFRLFWIKGVKTSVTPSSSKVHLEMFKVKFCNDFIFAKALLILLLKSLLTLVALILNFNC